MSDLVKSNDATTEIIKLPSLTPNEKTAVHYWTECGGELKEYLTYWCNDKRKLSLLQAPRVKKYIKQLSDKGECLPLIAGKDELEFILSTQVRATGDQKAIENLGKMAGYFPKENGGGPSVQILIVNDLAEVHNG
jgi:hypothetical protein